MLIFNIIKLNQAHEKEVNEKFVQVKKEANN